VGVGKKREERREKRDIEKEKREEREDLREERRPKTKGNQRLVQRSVKKTRRGGSR
jgi:hypothetical protein